MKDIYRGILVRLGSESPEVIAKAFAKWDHDTEMLRLADTDPAQLWSEKKLREFFEKDGEKTEQAFRFSIRTLAEDKLIGVISLDIQEWSHSDAWVGIIIGDREDWGKGYGTDAMQTILRFAFTEINLRRVTLNVFEYNPRGIRSYEKVGFQHEGRLRGALLRDGKRWDMLYMGILREDWMVKNGYSNNN